MDTVYCSHRCLLWTLLIILLNQCLEVSGSGRECPQGQLLHHQSPYSYCCYPTRCGVGHQVKPCSINGTHDTCQICPAYQNQSLRTSSFTMDQCTYWPLDKECKSVNNHQRNTADVRTKRCMCNIELGFRFIPPESESPWAPMDSYCQRRHTICLPGQEPVVIADTCQQCQLNYFKSSAGHTLCEPKTNCDMLGLKYVYTSNESTADNNCSEPDPVTTPKPYVPEPEPVTASHKPSPVVSSTVSSTAASTSTQDTGHYDSSRDLGKNDNSFAWPVVGVVLFLVMLILFIGLIMFWRKRKGKSVWVCATSKNCTDPEKNYPQGSSSLQGELQSKHSLGGGCVIPQHLTQGDKVTNNNVNGGLPCHMTYLPNGHPNGNIRHAHFSPPEHGNGDARSYCVSPLQYHLIPTSRPGILRGSNHNVVFGQSQGSVRDRSIDSIGQEKLQVHVDELEANQDVGENDPLLVSDHLHGAAPCHIQNLGAALGNSPPVVQAGVNPLHLLAYSGPGPARATFGPTFVHSSASSPHIPPQGPVVTCAPATGAATFTRSTSVIASPEGEVDEDEIEARLPRLSQLLTEGENSTVAQSDQSARGFFRADSPGRETTQQLRAPSQRLKDQFQPARNGNPMHQQPHPQGIYSAHQRPGFPPAVVGPVLQRGAQLNQPDHRIMNLKEQQLAESFNSTSNNPVTNGQQVKEHDLSATDTPKTVVSPEESQQTEVKTQLHPAVDSDFFTGTGMHLKTPKAGPDTGLATEPKQVDTGRAGENFVDRKRHVSGGGNNAQVNVAAHVQNSSDRMRVPSSGSNSSSQSTLERQRVPSGDQQRPCIKNSSPEEGDNNTAKRQQRYNRTVSFEEEDSPQPVNRQHGPSTESRSSAKSGNSPEKATNECRNRGPLRSVSDPEQKNAADMDSDCEETERKCVSLEYNASNGSSKCSVNSDYSGTDSTGGSPCRTALYRRSHSENASSGSDSAHKPPPRSMSEEKPQKLDRPIAKVKPMPASDNAVNQLPCEASDDAGITSQLPVAAVAPNNNAVAFDLTSDESDHEDNTESNNTTREEHDAIRESEEEDGL